MAGGKVGRRGWGVTYAIISPTMVNPGNLADNVDLIEEEKEEEDIWKEEGARREGGRREGG